MDNTNNEASVELRENMASRMYDANVALDRVSDALKDSDGLQKLMVIACMVRSVAAEASNIQAIARLLGTMILQDADSRLMPGTEKHQAHTERE